MFKDRIDAGQRLAQALQDYPYEKGIVIAVPRGGIVVGAQIAEVLQLPLDIIIPKKLGAPHQPEVAIGAVTQDGTVMLNNFLMERLDLTQEDLTEIIKESIAEIKRRMVAYRGKEDLYNLAGREVILVDDGIATGATIIAALKSIKNSGCKSITLAIPVAAPDAVETLKNEVDRLVCLCSQEPFYAVGQFYQNFKQTDDDEVLALLNK